MSNKIEELERKATDFENQIKQLQQEIASLKLGSSNQAVLDELHKIRSTIVTEKEEYENLMKQKDQEIEELKKIIEKKDYRINILKRYIQ
ncbi:hypothetical protein C9374_002343 [Naegleria lovaniensis]|uniref:Uncharacterized protein n=1 Tax=Naegleria lovaniensis TaxID=51637 RepID=A0AA88GVR2_NAELO|nr:uncharacterized protein C9374_002343 [Naegleria lovaniensis]KAG2386599.1 hypothetical protein C9374_002343 [Naegleria lovaniensis]